MRRLAALVIGAWQWARLETRVWIEKYDLSSVEAVTHEWQDEGYGRRLLE